MSKGIDYKKSVTRQITFPSRLMDIAESKAKIFGYSFPEYVRYVLTKDIENFYLGPEEYLDDPKLLKDIEDGIKEYREGKAISLKSPKEIEDYFSSLINEEE